MSTREMKQVGLVHQFLRYEANLDLENHFFTAIILSYTRHIKK